MTKRVAAFFVPFFLISITSYSCAQEKPVSLAKFMNKKFGYKKVESGALGEFARDIDKYMQIISGEAVFYKWHKNMKPNMNWIAPIQRTYGTLEDILRIYKDKGHKKEDHKTYETFFTKKRPVPSDAKIIVIGDNHAHPLDDILKFLQNNRDFLDRPYLDRNYKIIDRAKTFFVFLGDYLDNGQQPFRTVSTILKLYNQTPRNVFMLRGNHDLYFVSKYFQTAKSKRNPNNFLSQLNKVLLEDYTYDQETPIQVNPLIETFLRFFISHLPVATFLGCPDGNGNTNHILFCHGGPEFGHNPYPFLKSEATFEKIDTINRTRFMKNEYPEDVSIYFDKEKKDFFEKKKFTESIDNDLRGMITKGFHSQYGLPKTFNVLNEKPNSYYDRSIYIGYLWNRFLTESFEPNHHGFYLPHLLSFAMSRRQTEKWLSQYQESDKERIVSIFCGHAHKDEDFSKILMETELKKNDLYVRQWDGLINITIPTSNILKKKPKIEKQAFVIIGLNQDKAKWTVDHYVKHDGEKTFRRRSQSSGLLFAKT